jgi:fibrillarin-like pre-rRNA processing protein
MVQIKNSRFLNVFYINNELCTLNLAPGTSVYGETIYNVKGIEYRKWDPNRSKLAALIINGCKNLPMKPGSNILYLGAASGTTVSHISDIIKDGIIYCIEFSTRSFRDLLNVASYRKNLLPFLEDAFHPENYKSFVNQVDVLYQDLSQRDQVRAFLINAKKFLKKDGFGIFMIKSRSININRSPSEIFHEVIVELRSEGVKIIEQINLEPFSKDHMGLILKFK